MNKNIDIKNLKVAKRYAKALLEVGGLGLDEKIANLNAVKETVFDNPEFKMFFTHPVISLKDKKETIKEIFEGKINENILNFLYMLLENSRLNIFDTIYDTFIEESDKVKNITRADVTSVIELDENLKNDLKKKLENKLNKQIELQYVINKSILGGLLIQIEDKVIDLSLKSKFDKLKRI